MGTVDDAAALIRERGVEAAMAVLPVTTARDDLLHLFAADLLDARKALSDARIEGAPAHAGSGKGGSDAHHGTVRP